MMSCQQCTVVLEHDLCTNVPTGSCVFNLISPWIPCLSRAGFSERKKLAVQSNDPNSARISAVTISTTLSPKTYKLTNLSLWSLDVVAHTQDKRCQVIQKLVLCYYHCHYNCCYFGWAGCL